LYNQKRKKNTLRRYFTVSKNRKVETAACPCLVITKKGKHIIAPFPSKQ
jgi:hypothetical protein